MDKAYTLAEVPSSGSASSLSALQSLGSCLSLSSTSTSTHPHETRKPDILQHLQPYPQHPPSYHQANAPRAPVRFPVYEQQENYTLPPYEPAIHKLTLVTRKSEWLSPYEPSPVRHWRNLVMELNSTQLNFYSIDSVPLLRRVKKSKTRKHYDFTAVEQEAILSTIANNQQLYLTRSTLVKSYSLQHARFGIPIDYKKKNYCLRLRCETEQFLVHFISLDEMISWAQFLSVGINVSLELDRREMPADRTVPRRRRNRTRGSGSGRHRAYSDTELIRREMAPAKTPRRSSFSGFTSHITGSGDSDASSSRSRSSSISSAGDNNNTQGRFKTRFTTFFKRSKGPLTDFECETCSTTVDHSKVTKTKIQQSSNPSSVDTTISPRTPDVESFSPTDSEDHSELMITSAEISTIREEDEEEEEDQDEIHSIHDVHEEEDDEAEEEREIMEGSASDSDDESINMNHDSLFQSFSFNPDDHKEEEFEEEKWKPDIKKYSRRKFLKDSLRCIKLLPKDDYWVGKPIVRCSLPPNFQTCNFLNEGKFSRNKFLQEFLVGPNGLVPLAH